LADLVRRGADLTALVAGWAALAEPVREEILYRTRYRGYLEREQRLIERTARMESLRIPQGFDYTSVHGLKTESLQKLEQIRPATLGQAARISGVNPTDITILMLALS
jgi:tRNA uridine 5-carboxymethylaminomethyl modification enzyme